MMASEGKTREWKEQWNNKAKQQSHGVNQGTMPDGWTYVSPESKRCAKIKAELNEENNNKGEIAALNHYDLLYNKEEEEQNDDEQREQKESNDEHPTSTEHNERNRNGKRYNSQQTRGKEDDKW